MTQADVGPRPFNHWSFSVSKTTLFGVLAHARSIPTERLLFFTYLMQRQTHSFRCSEASSLFSQRTAHT